MAGEIKTNEIESTESGSQEGRKYARGSVVLDREKIKALRERGLFAGLLARLLAPPTEALPPTIRDHIPASYFKALSIPLRQMPGSVTL